MENNSLPTRSVDPAFIDKIRDELNELDMIRVEIDGNQLKPSQCYRFELDPFHLMFNTNCPDSLKEKVKAILDKYASTDESRSLK